MPLEVLEVRAAAEISSGAPRVWLQQGSAGSRLSLFRADQRPGNHGAGLRAFLRHYLTTANSRGHNLRSARRYLRMVEARSFAFSNRNHLRFPFALPELVGQLSPLAVAVNKADPFRGITPAELKYLENLPSEP